MANSHIPFRTAGRALPGILLMLLLLCRSQTAAEAARAGVAQCLQVIIPSLFPFFVAANLVLTSGAADLLARCLGRTIGRLFHLPAQAATPLVLGFLGGYPIGAKTAVALYTRGALTARQAELLLGFCNNTGPAIFLGLIGGCLFSGAALPITLYAIHIAAAVLTGVLLRQPLSVLQKHTAPQALAVRTGGFLTAVQDAMESTAKICAFVLFFSVLISLVQSLLPLPQTQTGLVLSALLAGALDLPSGIRALAALPDPAIRFLLASLFVNWGGLCIHMQTHSVIAPAALPDATHRRGKLLQSALAFLLSIPPYLHLGGAGGVLPVCAAIAALIAFLVWRGTENNSGNCAGSMVS